MRKNDKKIAIYGQNGDHLNNPSSTMSAFWAALGSGAKGITVKVFLTKDQKLVCAPSEHPSIAPKTLSELTLEEIQALDAGSGYRSTELDQHQQPTGKRGADRPWKSRENHFPLKKRTTLYYPELAEVFRTFGRRTEITVQLPTVQYEKLNALLTLLSDTLMDFGMFNRAYLCAELEVLQRLPEDYKTMDLIADLSGINSHDIDTNLLKDYLTNGFEFIQVNINTFIALNEVTQSASIDWRIKLNTNQFAPTPEQCDAIYRYQDVIEGIVSGGPLACHNSLYPKSIFFSEDFSGTKLDTTRWTGGYSHVNEETLITIDNGLIINIAEGKEYSGGGAMPLLGFLGDFDAVVDFHVANPEQATTFELAAIGIDPGYCQLNPKKLNSRSVNLTFDVHGSPPYASSERDQNDGFRCGWNNSYNLTKFGNENSKAKDTQWQPSSANMYNKYGRDVGDGSNQSLTGQLRLIRCGAVFNSYYRDQYNPGWVCSGSMLVSSLPDTAFIRLAAKHWHKNDTAPPKNCITFTNFKVAQ